MILPCCIGCKHASNNQCQQNYCWSYRVFRFFNKKYWVSRGELRWEHPKTSRRLGAVVKTEEIEGGIKFTIDMSK